MVPFYLFLFFLAALAFAQIPQRAKPTDLPSVVRVENNLDDSIIEIFNICKCVIFYQCDEDNFIIPQEELPFTRVTRNDSLKSIDRIRCSNEFYYCCKDKDESTTPQTLRQIPTSTTAVPLFLSTFTNSRPYSIGCGTGDTSGNKVINRFPWTVAIYKKKKFDNQYSFKCGGTLIHPTVVMTERKCVHVLADEKLSVFKGRELLNPDAMLSVSKTIEHELYYSGGMYNDIALIILESPVANVKPVCLPKHDQIFDDRMCTAVGWTGRTRMNKKKLRQVDLPVVNSQLCQHLLRNTSLGPDFHLHSSFICAGGEQGKHTCEGYEGGPLMCAENGKYVQAGIVSWGSECGKKDVPSLYTNVASLVPWIEQKLAAENLI